MQRIQPTKTSHFRERGLSLVELALVFVLLGILFPIFAYLLIGMYHDAFYTNDKAKASSETTQALLYIEEGVGTTRTFQTAVPGPYNDAYGPHNLGTNGAESWSYKGDSSTGRVLITQNFSTTVNALNSGRQPVFINSPNYSCATQMYYEPQLTYVTLYFVYNGTLYRRILTDKTTPLCPSNFQQQKQTCPPYISDASRDSSCQAYDEAMVTNVSNFSLDYYQIIQDGTSTQIDPSYSSTDQSILSTADYVNVTITVSTRSGAVTNTMSERMTKVNQ